METLANVTWREDDASQHVARFACQPPGRGAFASILTTGQRGTSVEKLVALFFIIIIFVNSPSSAADLDRGTRAAIENWCSQHKACDGQFASCRGGVPDYRVPDYRDPKVQACTGQRDRCAMNVPSVTSFPEGYLYDCATRSMYAKPTWNKPKCILSDHKAPGCEP
jgi:hypothetical protein